MAIAAGSKSKMSFVEETTAGTIPTSPSFTRMRYSNDNVKATRTTGQSNDITDSADVSAILDFGGNAGGTLNQDFYWGAGQHTILEHVGRADFASATAIDTGVTTLDIAAPGTITRAAGSFLTDGFLFGMRATLSGWTDSANNIDVTILSVSALSITVAEQTLVTESGGGDEQLQCPGQHLTFGTDEDKSMTLERSHDAAGTLLYWRFPGQRFNGMSLNTTPRSVITASYPMLGLREERGTTALSGSSYAAAATDKPFKAGDTGVMAVGGVAGTFIYTSITLNIANNLQDAAQIGSDDPAAILYNQRNIGGTIEAYLEDQVLYNAVQGGTAVSLAVPFTDNAGNWYNFVMPNVDWQDYEAPSPGNNTPVLQRFQFTAVRDSGIASALRVERSA